jgi:predicted Zn-dependent peptidase
MFGGSVNIPKYDEPLDRAGGENNAFTTADYTNYYISIPKENIETGFWLESDRMLSLAFSQSSLDVQKNVVIEEFNQRYLNQPYGDVWHILRPLAYRVHPYQWPVIGREPKHIAEATLDDVKDFFFHHYAPNNAILCVSGDIDNQQVIDLAQKWFGPIPRREVKSRVIPPEPIQDQRRELEVVRPVPFDSIYMAFPMCSRIHPDFSVTDMISDLLSSGKSSRLFQNLVKEKKLFGEVNAFITGDIDPGLLIVTGRLTPGVSYKDAEKAIDEELEDLVLKGITDYELEKVKNKFESAFLFGLTSPLEKAFNLSYYEMMGNADMINDVVKDYRQVSSDDIRRIAHNLFHSNRKTVLYYTAKK